MIQKAGVAFIFFGMATLLYINPKLGEKLMYAVCGRDAEGQFRYGITEEDPNYPYNAAIAAKERADIPWRNYPDRQPDPEPEDDPTTYYTPTPQALITTQSDQGGQACQAYAYDQDDPQDGDKATDLGSGYRNGRPGRPVHSRMYRVARETWRILSL